MGKILRFTSIILMSLTAAFTIMGGIGTTCVALAAEKYESMQAIVPYKWLYLLFVILTTAIGAMGVRAVVRLARGRQKAYRDSVITLLAGIIIGVIHMLVSRSLRGSSMPVDGVVYTTLITMFVFLLLRLPGVWQRVDFEKASKKDQQAAGGAAAFTAGGLSLTIHFWMASTHTLNGGINFGDAFHLTMFTAGWGLIIFGCFLVLLPRAQRQQTFLFKLKKIFNTG